MVNTTTEKNSANTTHSKLQFADSMWTGAGIELSVTRSEDRWLPGKCYDKPLPHERGERSEKEVNRP